MLDSDQLHSSLRFDLLCSEWSFHSCVFISVLHSIRHSLLESLLLAPSGYLIHLNQGGSQDSRGFSAGFLLLSFLSFPCFPSPVVEDYGVPCFDRILEVVFHGLHLLL